MAALVMVAPVTAGLVMASPAAADPGTSATEAAAPTANYIVVFKDTENVRRRGVANRARELSERRGARAGAIYQHALKGFSLQATPEQAQQVAADPDVAFVEEDKVIKIDADQVNPPSWGLDRIDQRTLPLNSRYTYTGTASNVTAYIIDTGIRTTHSDFGGRARSGYDFIDRDSDATDCQGHGTHVAGTVGGSSYGVAKGVRLVAVRVLDCSGYGTTSGVVAGIDWVAANAVKPAVANMSLGGPASAAIDRAVNNAIAAGITFVVAAGNESTNACNTSPARVPNAITVGATTNTDARASYSNYGSCLDIFAPGSGITSAWHTSNTASRSLNGTSMASPHVAGAAALVLSANPSATPAQVRNSLVANATSGRVTSAGSGSPNVLLYTGS